MIRVFHMGASDNIVVCMVMRHSDQCLKEIVTLMERALWRKRQVQYYFITAVEFSQIILNLGSGVESNCTLLLWWSQV